MFGVLNLGHFDFSSIAELRAFITSQLFAILDTCNVFGNVLTKSIGSYSELKCSFFKIICKFGILNFGHCNLFDI